MARIVARILVLVLVVLLLLLRRWGWLMGGLRLANAGRGDCKAIILKLLITLRPLLLVFALPAEVEKGQHSKRADNDNSPMSFVLASFKGPS